MVRVLGSTEGTRSNGTYDGYPSLDLTVNHPDDTVTVVRFVLADRRLYAVGVTGPDPLSVEDPRVKHFLDAFKVKAAVDVKGK